MRSTPMPRGLRSTLALTFVLLALIAATPLALAGPNPPGAPATPVSTTPKPSSPNSPNSYTLCGDCGNSGHNSTSFKTDDSAGSNYGWWFNDTSTQDSWGVLVSGGAKAIEGDGKAYGVYGKGGTYGVYGISSSNAGVYGSGSNYGVYGSGGTYGVYSSGSTYGLYAAGGTYGVYGASANGVGVTGTTAAAGKSGVIGAFTSVANAGYGVRGYIASTSRVSYGGYFSATAGIGLYGQSNDNYGVTASSAASIGLRAVSGSSYGVYATTTSGPITLRAINPSKAAGHYAGYFDGNVYIAGSYVATGTKSALVYTDQGDRLMYAEEATQNYFSDQGTATLKDGRAVIKIDPLFAQTVNLNTDYQVLVTPNTLDTSGLGVINRTAASFEVGELQGGKGNFSFTWRITALRKGYETTRMAPAPPAADKISDNLDK